MKKLRQIRTTDVYKEFGRTFSGGATAFISKIRTRPNVIQHIHDNYGNNNQISIRDLLEMYNWFSEYNSYPSHASSWKYNNGSYQKNLFATVSTLSKHLNTIALDNRLMGWKSDHKHLVRQSFADTFSVVDFFPGKIRRPEDETLEDLLYDAKHGFHSLLYFIDVNPRNGYINEFQGEFLGSAREITLYKRIRVITKDLRLTSEKRMGDKIFSCFPDVNTIHDMKGFDRNVFNSARQIVEQVIGRGNVYDIVKTKAFRADLSFHSKIINIIYNTVNIDLMLNQPYEYNFFYMTNKDVFKREMEKLEDCEDYLANLHGDINSFRF